MDKFKRGVPHNVLKSCIPSEKNMVYIVNIKSYTVNRRVGYKWPIVADSLLLHIKITLSVSANLILLKIIESTQTCTISFVH